MSKISNVYIRPLIFSDEYWMLETQKELIEKWEQNTKKDIEYRFGIFKINDDNLIGTIGLFQVFRGPRESALLGYSLDQEVGFHKEGIAKKNVKINGSWEDHQMLAIINSNDLPSIHNNH